MISGRRTLGTFEQALAEIRQKLEEVDKQTNELTDRQLALEQEDLADYRQLARLRVDLLATEKAQSSLDEAERLTKALLEKRQIELAAIGEEITAAKKKGEEFALHREEQAAAVAVLSDQIDNAEKRPRTGWTGTRSMFSSVMQYRLLSVQFSTQKRRPNRVRRNWKAKGNPIVTTLCLCISGREDTRQQITGEVHSPAGWTDGWHG